MRLGWWIIPALACVLCDLSLVIVALDESPRRAAQLLLGAQVIAVSVAAAVPYLLLERPIGTRLAYGGSMACHPAPADPIPVTMRRPTPVN